jgi:hypothetical protein
MATVNSSTKKIKEKYEWNEEGCRLDLKPSPDEN